MVFFHQSRFNLHGDVSSMTVADTRYFHQSLFDLHGRFFINTASNDTVQLA